jgi:hypothetical protein
VILAAVSLVFIFWLFNQGVSKVMATLQDVKDSLTQVQKDVDAMPGNVPPGDGIFVTEAEVQGVLDQISTIDDSVISKSFPPGDPGALADAKARIAAARKALR